MVRNYQRSQTHKASSKVKEIAEHISPASAEHFAETKRTGLPMHVKEANFRGWLANQAKYSARNQANQVTLDKQVTDQNKNTHELYRMTGDEAAAAAKDIAKELPNHKKPFLKFYNKKEASEQFNDMNKQAFDRGFIKAAMAVGVHPLQAVSLLKQAGGIGDFITDPANAQLVGGLGGAAVGGLGGAMMGGKHKLRNGLLGAAAGGGLGALAGGYLNPANTPTGPGAMGHDDITGGPSPVGEQLGVGGSPASPSLDASHLELPQSNFNNPSLSGAGSANSLVEMMNKRLQNPSSQDLSEGQGYINAQEGPILAELAKNKNLMQEFSKNRQALANPASGLGVAGKAIGDTTSDAGAALKSLGSLPSAYGNMAGQSLDLGAHEVGKDIKGGVNAVKGGVNSLLGNQAPIDPGTNGAAEAAKRRAELLQKLHDISIGKQ